MGLTTKPARASSSGSSPRALRWLAPTRRRTRAVIVVAAVAAALIAVDAVRLWQAERLNRLVAGIAAGERAAGGAASAAGGESSAELLFAEAQAQAASGATDAALNRYRALQGDTPLGQAARYNSANLLLRQAMEVAASAQPAQATPLLELAKETYREVLRADPEHWPARYNLERAQRLLPDPDDAGDDAAAPGANRERAVTTMRGYSPGLP